MKKIVFLLVLSLCTLATWAQPLHERYDFSAVTPAGQTLAEYNFQTGVNASKWITLSSPSVIWNTYQDDVASGVYNIGFDFPFCREMYRQFSVSSNGVFRLGSAAASATTTAGQFTSSRYNQDLPKICGIARDLGTGSNGGVRYQLTGTAPNRILVCEFAMGRTYGSSYTADVKWQVQLHENGTVGIVYGPTAPSTTPSSFQTGLASASDDIVILNPSTHQPIYCTGAHATTYSTWHGANRYYEFSPTGKELYYSIISSTPPCRVEVTCPYEEFENPWGSMMMGDLSEHLIAAA